MRTRQKIRCVNLAVSTGHANERNGAGIMMQHIKEATGIEISSGRYMILQFDHWETILQYLSPEHKRQLEDQDIKPQTAYIY